MDDAKQGFPARCSGCGKRYRVTSRARALVCKACGAALAIDTTAEAGKPSKRAETVERQRRHREKDERYATSREIGNARKVISLARTWFGLSAVFLAWMTLNFWSGSIPELTGEVGGSFPRGLLLAVGIALTLQATIAVLGFLFVRKRPFAWTLVLAIVQTLVAGLLVLSVDLARWPRAIVLSFALGWWSLLVPVFRVGRLARENADLFASRQYLREAGAKDAGAPARGASDGSTARIVGIVAAAAAAGLLVAAFVSWSNRIPDFDAVPAKLRAAWSERGTEGVLGLVDASRLASSGATIRASLDELGWGDEPKLDESAPRVDERDDGRTRVVHHRGPEGPVTSTWTIVGGEWSLDELRTPIGRLPERFREAWNGGDVASIAGYFGRPERIEPGLRKTFERRGWTAAMPEAQPALVRHETDGTASTDYATSAGRLIVRWRFTDGRWVAVSLDPP